MTTATWWEISTWADKPKPHNVVGETERTITLEVKTFGGTKVRKASKETSYSKYFRTEREALVYLVERAAKKLAHAKETLNEAEIASVAAREALRKYEESQ